MSNSLVDALEDQFNFTHTENGALAHKHTDSKVLDMFAHGASYRNRPDDDCILLFKNAYDENPDLAMKCLFYLRDVRGGQGERRFFRVAFHWLANNYPEIAKKNIENIPEYGRFDDLYCLVDTPLEKEMFKYMKSVVVGDIKNNGYKK